MHGGVAIRRSAGSNARGAVPQHPPSSAAAFQSTAPFRRVAVGMPPARDLPVPLSSPTPAAILAALADIGGPTSLKFGLKQQRGNGGIALTADSIARPNFLRTVATFCTTTLQANINMDQVYTSITVQYKPARALVRRFAHHSFILGFGSTAADAIAPGSRHAFLVERPGEEPKVAPLSPVPIEARKGSHFALVPTWDIPGGVEVDEHCFLIIAQLALINSEPKASAALLATAGFPPFPGMLRWSTAIQNMNLPGSTSNIPDIEQAVKWLLTRHIAAVRPRVIVIAPPRKKAKRIQEGFCRRCHCLACADAKKSADSIATSSSSLPLPGTPP